MRSDPDSGMKLAGIGEVPFTGAFRTDPSHPTPLCGASSMPAAGQVGRGIDHDGDWSLLTWVA